MAGFSYDIAYNVLFVDSFASTTSVMGERLLDNMSLGRFKGYSAGSHPAAYLHAMTVRTLKALHLSSDGLHCKGLAPFVGDHGLEMDFIFIVGDLRIDRAPAWTGQPMVADWRVPDPAASDASEAAAQAAFMSTALALRRRIELMLALPPERLEAMTARSGFMDLGSA